MNSERTQISRGAKVSVPTRLFLDRFKVDDMRLLHHGAGRAQSDSEAMLEAGAREVVEFDPNSPNKNSRNPDVLDDVYDVIISNFVLNTLKQDHRSAVIGDLWRASIGKNGCAAYITVRSTGDRSIKGTPCEDGVITSRNTFQKGYTVKDLERELLVWFDRTELVHKSSTYIMMAAWDTINPVGEPGRLDSTEDNS